MCLTKVLIYRPNKECSNAFEQKFMHTQLDSGEELYGEKNFNAGGHPELSG